MKRDMKKLLRSNKRKITANGNHKVLQNATAAAVVGGAGLAGFYAWQNAARKKRRGFLNLGKSTPGSRFRLFSR